MSEPERRVKALSIRQPWAWAVIYGGKDIENRPAGAVKMMAHAVGRRIFIHAAKSRLDLESGLRSLRTRGLKPPQPKAFPLGGVIGSVKLAAIVERSRSTWFSGAYGLLLEDPRPCPFFDVRGQLGLFFVTPPDEIVP